MKLLYITDTHLRGNNPRNRMDDFPAALKAKLQEIVELAAELEVDYLLHGGDVFDLPSPSLAVVSGFTDILQEMQIPIYAIAGNHDLFAYNPATLERTMIGFLDRLGLLRLLKPGEPVYLKNKNVTLQLTGQHFHYEIDRRDARADYCVAKRNCDVAVHMVHGMLLRKVIYPGAAYTLVEHVAPYTQADFTLGGHAHLGFRDVEYDGRLFVNPGAIARLSALVQELDRRPQAVLLDFTGSKPVCRHIVLKSARPGAEVLDRSRLNKTAFQEEKLHQFIQEVRSSGDYQGSSLEDIIQTIADRQNLDNHVREEALKRLSAAREELGV